MSIEEETVNQLNIVVKFTFMFPSKMDAIIVKSKKAKAEYIMTYRESETRPVFREALTLKREDLMVI